jgi:hypothetical protein
VTRIVVVTGWSPAGYREYGRRFVETWSRFWPRSVELVVYVEEPCDLPLGAIARDLAAVPGVQEFLRVHGADAEARGRAVLPTWKESARRMGYNWRFDAVKWFRQAFIMRDAAAGLWQGADTLLCWLDGDVVTHRAVPLEFLPSLLPRGRCVAFLGRGDKHSEIGFQLYRPAAFPMLECWSSLYESGEFKRHKEWHSAYLWDVARRATLEPADWHDLTPGGHGHVWHASVLAQYTDHLKGERKKHGRSPERRR